jgi:hypothetical protein
VLACLVLLANVNEFNQLDWLAAELGKRMKEI